MDTIPIDDHLALRVRFVLQAIVRDLAAVAVSPRYVDTAGLPEAIAAILIPVRELDSVLPGNDLAQIAEPVVFEWLCNPEAVCDRPIHLPLDTACDLILLAVDHSRNLNDLLCDVLQVTPRPEPTLPRTRNDDARRLTSLCFSQVLGYLYTEIMHPLHQQHPELKDLVFG
ncbi:MAG: hypothetical protein RL701_869 [Pseudomonadota bacterium]|jgi:hypothetical protein